MALPDQGAYVEAMSHPIAVTGFDHIVLRIRDKARMLDFYQRVLGLSVDRDRPELGLTHIRAGGQMIDLVVRDAGSEPADGGRNLDHFALQVRPFDEAAIRGHLAAHGIEIVGEGLRYGAEGDGFSLYVFDPEGNMVELKGPAA